MQDSVHFPAIIFCTIALLLDTLKTGYIEFAMAGNYSTVGIVQMCNHWAPASGRWQ